MQYVIVMLFCIHALVHLIGVLRQWERAEAPALGSPTFRPPTAVSNRMGILWLTACVTLFIAALLLVQGDDRWWAVALGGVLLSQFLVVFSWSAAKTGTAVNVVLGLAILVGWAHARFVKDGEILARDLMARASSAEASLATTEEVARLPMPVQRWLVSAGVVGKPRAVNVRLRQRGGLRTSADGDFVPALADQYFSVTEPAFVWRVRVPLFHLPFYGRDTYLDGRGHMLIKALGLVPIADAASREVDQGTLLRFLGETVWFPSAALSPYVRWEVIDDVSARATMTYGDVTDSADFFFDAEGRVERIAALRYLQEGDEPPRLQRWVVNNTRWQPMNGLLIPVEGEVTWELKTGHFTYYRWEITEIAQNVSALYEEAP
jgi:hypothetical protein